MTIGIATRGPRAGRAAYEALLATELLGRGAIGGFCVFVWRDEGGFRIATTQRGGTSGLTLPPGWEEARHAALISSGPDRPEPLAQFLPFDPAKGMVTGHRLPSSPLPDGRPANRAALEAMGPGFGAEALAALLAAPGMDAGLICLPLSGPCVIGNAPRVETRDDTGRHLHEDGTRSCAVLLNSIFTATLPGDGLAGAVAAVAVAAMGGAPAPLRPAWLADCVPVRRAAREAVLLDADGVVRSIESADPAYARPRPRITAVYSGVPVLKGGVTVGHAATEVFADLRDGMLRPGAAEAERCFLYAAGA